MALLLAVECFYPKKLKLCKLMQYVVMCTKIIMTRAKNYNI